MIKAFTNYLSKNLLLLLLAGLIVLLVVSYEATLYRWSVKTLTDPQGLKILNEEPIKTSIKKLNKLKRPEIDLIGETRTLAECQKVTANGTLVMIGLADDGDYHFIMINEKGDSLVCEIPDPEQWPVKMYPEIKRHFTISRDFIDSKIGEPTFGVKPCANIKVKVTGFIFFDKPKQRTGHSANGIEIHPVWMIEER